MTKEELEQEAEEYALKNWEGQCPWGIIAKAYEEGAEPREKRIAELKEKLEIEKNDRGDWFKKAVTKDRQLTEANENLSYAKAIMRELLDNSNEYARQNAEDFIKE